MRKKEMSYKEISYIIIGLLLVSSYLYGVGVIISWAIGGVFKTSVEWYFGTVLYVFFGNITDVV